MIEVGFSIIDEDKSFVATLPEVPRKGDWVEHSNDDYVVADVVWFTSTDTHPVVYLGYS